MEKADVMTDSRKVQSWLEKGKRLQQLRNMGHLKRKEMAEFARVAANTYKFWELGDSNLIEERARWIIDGLQTVGIECNAEWLMTGIGDPPAKHKTIFDEGVAILKKSGSQKATTLDEKKLVMEELECFCHHNQNSIGLVVADNSMAPNYNCDDVVAGMQYAKDEIRRLVGIDCIIKLTNGSLLLRNLNVGSKEGFYTLLTVNPQAKNKIMQDVEIETAAPVLWHRRLNKW